MKFCLINKETNQVVVEFDSFEEADNAFYKIKNKHLYQIVPIIEDKDVVR